VAVHDRAVERLASRRDLFLGQVGIGAVIEEQLHDVEPAGRRGVGDRGAGAEIVALVPTEPVGQRRILGEQLAHAIEIAGVTRGRQIDEAPRDRRCAITCAADTGQSRGTSRQPR
jgi:hypothetical protein